MDRHHVPGLLINKQKKIYIMLCVIVFDGNGKNHGIIAGNQTKMVYILNNFVSKSISG